MQDSGSVLGIGTDVVSYEEFRATLARTPEFIDRYFTVGEIQASRERADPLLSLAGMFAAKESLLKAFGAGLFEACELKDIEIAHRPNGQPFFKTIPLLLRERIDGVREAFVTISHAASYAVAAVALVK